MNITTWVLQFGQRPATATMPPSDEISSGSSSIWTVSQHGQKPCISSGSSTNGPSPGLGGPPGGGGTSSGGVGLQRAGGGGGAPAGVTPPTAVMSKRCRVSGVISGGAALPDQRSSTVGASREDFGPKGNAWNSSRNCWPGAMVSAWLSVTGAAVGGVRRSPGSVS